MGFCECRIEKVLLGRAARASGRFCPPAVADPREAGFLPVAALVSTTWRAFARSEFVGRGARCNHWFRLILVSH